MVGHAEGRRPLSPPRSIAIRPAVLGDAEAIRQVQSAAARGLCSADYTPEQMGAWTGRETSHYEQRLRDAGCSTLVAEADGRVVAFSGRIGGELLSLYVQPEWAGRGVGAALLAQVESEAAAEGHGELTLNSSVTAVPFYERQGYTVAGPGSYERDGVAIPCVRMAKGLE